MRYITRPFECAYVYKEREDTESVCEEKDEGEQTSMLPKSHPRENKPPLQFGRLSELNCTLGIEPTLTKKPRAHKHQ
jgi:hypothetical protein